MRYKIRNGNDSIYKSLMEERGYIFIGSKIEKKRTVLLYKCQKHLEKDILKIRLDVFNLGSGCKYCSVDKLHNDKRWNHEQFSNEFYKKFSKSEYNIVSEYKTANEPIVIRHIPCNYEYPITAHNAISGNGCPACNYGERTTKHFKKDVKKLTYDEYEVMGEYLNATTKILMKHIECGNVYPVTPSKFYLGRRCPYCVDVQNSRLSLLIESFIKYNKITYKREWRFDDCRYIYPLPFDFAILKDSKPFILIEADGIHHFCERVSYYGGNREYSEIVRNDNIKNQYCISKNIPLFRISYKEENNVYNIMNEIFAKFFNNINIPPDDYLYTSKILKGRKLSNEQILEIKELYNTDRYSQQKLGKMFSVSKPTIAKYLKY